MKQPNALMKYVSFSTAKAVYLGYVHWSSWVKILIVVPGPGKDVACETISSVGEHLLTLGLDKLIQGLLICMNLIDEL